MADQIGFESAAWSIDGARIDSGLMRLLAYASTGGAEGVVSPGDCRVHELGVPGTQIEIDTGAILILNRSANVRNQTYVADASQITRLDVQATTSAGGRSDLVVLRLEDPEFQQWEPGPTTEAEAWDWQYARPFIIQNVPPGTTDFAQLGLPYSAYALARIDIPAETGTIINAYIKNLREVARPRREPFNDRYDQTQAGEVSVGALNDWVKYPLNMPDAQLAVPAFATKAIIRVTPTGLQLIEGNLSGLFRFSLLGGVPHTTVSTKTTYVNEQTVAGERNSYLVSSTINIPASQRGRTVAGRLEWAKRGGTGRWSVDLDTQMVVDIDFVGGVV